MVVVERGAMNSEVRKFDPLEKVRWPELLACQDFGFLVRKVSNIRFVEPAYFSNVKQNNTIEWLHIAAE